MQANVMPKQIHPWRTLLIEAALLLLIAGAGGFFIWYKLMREIPQSFASQEEDFEYGSIGIENEDGLAYLVWMALPRIFPEYLPGPGGYRSLGMVWEEGHDTPVGFSKKIIGFPRIAINCAVCHTATYRTAPDQPQQIVPTGP